MDGATDAGNSLEEGETQDDASESSGALKLKLNLAKVLGPFSTEGEYTVISISASINPAAGTEFESSLQMLENGLSLSNPATITPILALKDRQVWSIKVADSYFKDGETYELTFRAIDEKSQVELDSAKARFSWDATAPEVEAGNEILARAGFLRAAEVSDKHLSELAWTQVSGPGALSFSASDQKTTTIAADTDGTYVVRLSAIDQAGNKASDEVDFIWDSTVPNVNAGTDLTSNSAIAVTNSSASDEHTLSYQWLKVSGPGTVTFSDANALLPTLSASQSGLYVLKLTATDAAGNASFDSMHFRWDSDAPSVEAGPNLAAAAMIAVSGASASDLSALSYLWTQVSGPGTVTFADANDLKPDLSADQDGVYVLKLTATDAFGYASFDTLNFVWDTDPPTVNAGANISTASQVAAAGASASDLSAMTYLWTQVSGPGTVAFSDATDLQPDLAANQNGVYVLKLTATDALGNSDFDTLNFVWDTANPTVDAGASIATAVQVAASGASASDLTTLSYLWTKISGPGTVSFSDDTDLQPDLSADQDGAYVLRLTATDALGHSSFDHLNFIWDTDAPTVDAGSDLLSDIPIAPSSASASDTNALSYLWTQVSGPGTAAFSDATLLQPDFSADQDGTYVLKLTATDAAGNSDFDTLSFAWDTSPPTVNAGSDISSSIAVAIDATTADAISGLASHAWSKVSGPGSLIFSETDAADTFVYASDPGVYVLRLTATDALGQSASDDVTLTWSEGMKYRFKRLAAGGVLYL